MYQIRLFADWAHLPDLAGRGWCCDRCGGISPPGLSISVSMGLECDGTEQKTDTGG
jgi:hypothetical protein